MIHYHGTPCGGERANVPRFLRARHALIPYMRQEDMEAAAVECASFIFDNSAFTAWNSNRPITDWTGYYAFVGDWCRHPGFDWALIPDVINGTEQENDVLVEEWLDSELSKYGVPVWHMHESPERLGRLMVRFRRIALGSSGEFRKPGSKKWWGRMSEAMSVLCDESGRPCVKLHGLRMADLRIANHLPLSSADSTNAAQNGNRTARKNGTPTLQGMVSIADRVESVQPAEVWTPRDTYLELPFTC